MQRHLKFDLNTNKKNPRSVLHYNDNNYLYRFLLAYFLKNKKKIKP